MICYESTITIRKADTHMHAMPSKRPRISCGARAGLRTKSPGLATVHGVGIANDMKVGSLDDIERYCSATLADDQVI